MADCSKLSISLKCNCAVNVKHKQGDGIKGYVCFLAASFPNYYTVCTLSHSVFLFGFHDTMWVGGLGAGGAGSSTLWTTSFRKKKKKKHNLTRSGIKEEK